MESPPTPYYDTGHVTPPTTSYQGAQDDICTKHMECSTTHVVLATVVLLLAVVLDGMLLYLGRLVWFATWYAVGAAVKLTVYLAVVVLVLLVLWLTWKTTRQIWHIMTFSSDKLFINHDCITPDSWDHRPSVQQQSVHFLQQHYPDIADLAQDGSLVVLRPADLLLQLKSGKLEPPDRSRSADADLNEDEIVCLQGPPSGCIMLLGTSHVSKKSAEDVKRAIKVRGRRFWS